MAQISNQGLLGKKGPCIRRGKLGTDGDTKYDGITDISLAGKRPAGWKYKQTGGTRSSPSSMKRKRTRATFGFNKEATTSKIQGGIKIGTRKRALE